MVNEWVLQQELTKRWLDRGIGLADEDLLLVAWELMVPSWAINDALMRWNEPSIDFLAMDKAGRLVAIELKVAVPGRKPAWAVLCQVTHRAVCISRTAAPELVERAHEECLRGDHGRSEVSSGEVASLSSRFRELFGADLHQPAPSGRGIRRVVAATSFGPSFEAIRRRFDQIPLANVVEDLSAGNPGSKSQAARECRRLGGILPISAFELATPVETLIVSM